MAHRREALRLGVPHALEQLLLRLPEYVVVHSGAVAGLAAEKLVDGYAEVLAGDVPQRDVDGAYRAHYRRPAKVAEAEHVLPVVLDQLRVLAHQIAPELRRSRSRRLQVSPGARLADPGQTRVRRDPDEQVPVDEQRLDRYYLHATPPIASRSRGRVP